MRIIWPGGLLLVPYVPLGTLVLILRILIYTQALLASFILCSCGTIRRFVLRVMCFVLGIVVVVKSNATRTDKMNTVPFVSNHVTLFDHLALCLTRDCTTPHTEVFHWFSSCIEPPKEESLRQFISQGTQKAVKSWHLLPQRNPTGASTDMTGFDASLFEFLDKVQPVALVVTRPFPVRLVSCPINWFTELLWQLFVPFTIYRVTFLPPMSRQTNELTSDYAERVRLAIADACHSTEITPATKESLSEPQIGDGITSKKPFSSPEDVTDETFVRHRSSVSSQKTSTQKLHNDISNPFDHLLPIVKEVLNDVNDDRIRRFLMQTEGDVDATIDALLTGTDSLMVDDHAGTSKLNSSTPVSRLNTAVPTFSSNSTARQQSLIERRQMLLSYAKGRFIASSTESG